MIGKRRVAAGAVGGQPLSGNRPGGQLERGVETQPIEVLLNSGQTTLYGRALQSGVLLMKSEEQESKQRHIS